MRTGFLNFLNFGTAFFGLEIFTYQKSEYYALILVKEKKGELTIAESHVFDNWEKMIAHVNPKTPICISFNTENVIIKEIPNKIKGHNETLVNQIFPSIPIDKIYYEVVNLASSKYISISNQKEIKQVIERLKKNKFNPISISLGITGITYILPYLKNKIIETNCHNLALNNLNLVSFNQRGEKVSEKNYNINGLKISNKFLLSFSCVLSNKIGTQKISSNLTGAIKSLKNEFSSKRKFTIVSQSFLVILLVILLSNFFLFDFYYDRSEKLLQETSIYEIKRKNYSDILERVKSKENRLFVIDSNSNSKVTYLLDQLAGSIETSTVLEQLTYQPIARTIKINQPISVSENTILINGSTSNKILFVNWLNEVESNYWVKSVETLGFEQKRKTTFFSIKLILNEL